MSKLALMMIGSMTRVDSTGASRSSVLVMLSCPGALPHLGVESGWQAIVVLVVLALKVSLW